MIVCVFVCVFVGVNVGVVVLVGVFVAVGVLVGVTVTNTPHRAKLTIVPLVSTSTAYSFPPKVNLVNLLFPL